MIRLSFCFVLFSLEPYPIETILAVLRGPDVVPEMELGEPHARKTCTGAPVWLTFII